MEKLCIAGFYVMKTMPIKWGEYKDAHIPTLSFCINMMVYDNWCLDWNYEYGFEEGVEEELKLTDDKIKAIRSWTNKHIPFSLAACLPTLKMAKDFKELFFKERDDINVYSLSFPKTDAENLINYFAVGNNPNGLKYNDGNFGPISNLLKKNLDKDKENEIVLGYDFIAMDGGGTFCSFYCYDYLVKGIADKFSMKLNAHGFFDKIKDADAIRAYLNDPKTLNKPDPWYIARVKLIQ